MKTRLIALFAALFLSSCLELANNQTAAGTNSCSTALYGQWKQRTGYIGAEPSSNQLQHTFNQLVIAQGTRMCSVAIENQLTDRILYKADYALDIDENEITISLTEGASASGQSSRATYSFTGNCFDNSAELILSYSNGHQERYQPISRQASDYRPDICDPQ